METTDPVIRPDRLGRGSEHVHGFALNGVDVLAMRRTHLTERICRRLTFDHEQFVLDEVGIGGHGGSLRLQKF